MDKGKHNIYFILSAIYLIITCGINIFGYFHLPEEIATQISFSGEQVNHMPTLLYMFIVFIIVLLLSLFTMTKGQEQKLKYLLVNAIIVIANIVMIVTQL